MWRLCNFATGGCKTIRPRWVIFVNEQGAWGSADVDLAFTEPFLPTGSNEGGRRTRAQRPKNGKLRKKGAAGSKSTLHLDLSGTGDESIGQAAGVAPVGMDPLAGMTDSPGDRTAATKPASKPRAVIGIIPTLSPRSVA